MNIWWLPTLVTLTCTLIKITEPTLTCLYGDKLPIPSECTSVQDCGTHEFCSLEQYITPNGFIRHKAACKDRNVCGGSTVPGTYMVVCSECCDTNLCAATGCHSTGYNPICYHCSYPVDDIKHCDRIRVCSADEVCAAHRTPFGQYRVGCESKTTCNTVKSIGVCSSCCTRDLCNRNCTVSSSAVVPTTSCSDGKDCQTISSALAATGKDICQDSQLKHFCNSTCGLCPGQTTRAVMTVPTTSSRPSTTAKTSLTTTGTAQNLCSPNPCLHGTCIQAGSVPVCVCNPGYTGLTCDTTDPCFTNPCVHGTCVAIPGSFHCTCHTNFTGRLCDTSIVQDPCSPNPCVHGTCTRTRQTYKCSCNAGYTGVTCAVRDPCSPNPCVHGTCTTSGQSYTCLCNTGHSGPTCAVLNPCSPNPCAHGTCTQIGVTFTCNCNTGYTGAACSTVQNPCLPNPCVHGSCSAAGTSYTCQCNSGYVGKTCDKVDPCALAPCVHGTCSSTSSGGYHCACQAGYTGAGCDTDIDECQSSPCVHGLCQDKVNGYMCSCFPGYTDKQCSTDIDNCSPVNPCVHGTCQDQVNGFHCVCSNGYTGTICDKLAKIRDCKDVLDSGISHGDGTYVVEIGNKQKHVKCDMKTAGGGWMEIMYRHNGSVDFQNRDSTDYAVGFGHKRDEFWQGLEYTHDLTSDGRRYQLRVDMVAANGTHFYEVYDDFWIGPARNFQLHIGSFRGTAGDSLSGHNGFGFTTTDHDVDSNPVNCANYLSGAWWFHDCYDSCLTCPYVHAAPGTSECSSMSWNSIRYCEPLKEAKMMVRPM